MNLLVNLTFVLFIILVGSGPGLMI